MLDSCIEQENSSPAGPLSAPASKTPRRGQELSEYLQGINGYELLTREETEELAFRFQKHHDLAACQRLVAGNLRLVIKIAMDHQGYWMQNFSDLVQEGNVGLVMAARKFDPDRGVKFSYYAAYWIRAYIMKYIMDNWRLVKLGTTQVQRRLFYSLNREKKRLEAQGIQPDAELLAERLDADAAVVAEMDQRVNGPDMSLDAPVWQDTGIEHRDLLPADGPDVEEIAAGRELRERLHTIIDSRQVDLDEREKVILRDRFFTGNSRTLSSIAGQFRVSRERIRQVEVRLAEKLRKILKQELPEYV